MNPLQNSEFHYNPDDELIEGTPQYAAAKKILRSIGIENIETVASEIQTNSEPPRIIELCNTSYLTEEKIGSPEQTLPEPDSNTPKKIEDQSDVESCETQTEPILKTVPPKPDSENNLETPVETPSWMNFASKKRRTRMTSSQETPIIEPTMVTKPKMPTKHISEKDLDSIDWSDIEKHTSSYACKKLGQLGHICRFDDDSLVNNLPGYCMTLNNIFHDTRSQWYTRILCNYMFTSIIIVPENALGLKKLVSIFSFGFKELKTVLGIEVIYENTPMDLQFSDIQSLIELPVNDENVSIFPIFRYFKSFIKRFSAVELGEEHSDVKFRTTAALLYCRVEEFRKKGVSIEFEEDLSEILPELYASARLYSDSNTTLDDSYVPLNYLVHPYSVKNIERSSKKSIFREFNKLGYGTSAFDYLLTEDFDLQDYTLLVSATSYLITPIRPESDYFKEDITYLILYLNNTLHNPNFIDIQPDCRLPFKKKYDCLSKADIFLTNFIFEGSIAVEEYTTYGYEVMQSALNEAYKMMIKKYSFSESSRAWMVADHYKLSAEQMISQIDKRFTEKYEGLRSIRRLEIKSLQRP